MARRQAHAGRRVGQEGFFGPRLSGYDKARCVFAVERPASGGLPPSCVGQERTTRRARLAPKPARLEKDPRGSPKGGDVDWSASWLKGAKLLRQPADSRPRVVEPHRRPAVDGADLFRMVADNVREAIFVWDGTAREVLFASPACELIWGTSGESSHKHPEAWIKTVHAGDRERVRTGLSHISASGFDEEYRIVRPNGVVRWVHHRAFPLVGAAGSVEQIVSIADDVTEKKRGDAAVRKIEQKYQRLMEGLQHDYFLYTHDTDGVFTYVSPSVTEVLGYAQEEFLRHHQDYETDNPINQQTARHTALSVKGVRQPAYEVEVYHKGGSVRRMSVREVPVFDETGRVVAVDGLALDVTEYRALEEQLEQSQKMEAIGQLAGGIAHDFNNLLTGITGFCCLALGRLPGDSPVAADLENIREIADRASGLTKQLLTFSRRQPLETTVLDINQLVADTGRMLPHLIGEHIELCLTTYPGQLAARVDGGQFEQVLVNLAINARDAMPEGGKLTIETESVTLDEDYVSRRGVVKPGSYLMMAVTDTGSGMDAETRERAFEPFFTTKEVGSGTGLGLSTVYGIVKRHDGYIWVYSEPGHGTTFKVYFPQVLEEAEETREAPRVVGEARPGSETILVVEDEPMVLRLLRRTLEGQGYRVLFAESPAEAREISEREHSRISLLLTDVVMPGGTGPELYTALREQGTSFKVLFMSGYAELGVRSSGKLDPTAPFISKPFTPELLARKVREVLDA
ncbi:MAG TPA: PAS domain-containing protein [Acidobacteriota bacterium]